jgi:hypothetical protein
MDNKQLVEKSKAYAKVRMDLRETDSNKTGSLKLELARAYRVGFMTAKAIAYQQQQESGTNEPTDGTDAKI